MLIEQIKELDKDSISLYVLTSNKKAIAFYEKNDFIKIKTLEEYYTTLPVKSAHYYVFNKKI